MSYRMENRVIKLIPCWSVQSSMNDEWTGRTGNYSRTSFENWYLQSDFPKDAQNLGAKHGMREVRVVAIGAMTQWKSKLEGRIHCIFPMHCSAIVIAPPSGQTKAKCRMELTAKDSQSIFLVETQFQSLPGQFNRRPNDLLALHYSPLSAKRDCNF